jgi:uncharacterized membrane protein YkgB
MDRRLSRIGSGWFSTAGFDQNADFIQLCSVQKRLNGKITAQTTKGSSAMDTQLDAAQDQNLAGEPHEATSDFLTKIALWIGEHDVAFKVTSVGMIVMLLWAGSYKMTRPGAEGIIPLVSNSPLISWHFKLFGPYVGSDIIGLSEITAALLFLLGYAKPRAGIIGGLIASLMFFITSTMVITTPGAIISVPGIQGMRYMSFLGLFLFKDILGLGVAISLIGRFGSKAVATGRSHR